MSRAAAAFAAVLMLSACTQETVGGPPVSGVVVSDEDGLHGAVLDEPYVVPDVSLTATDMSSFSLSRDTTEPWTLVFFGYTRCPDICQIVMADIASALTRLDAAQRGRVAMVFVTSDPARDDPSTLRGYLDRFDPSFEGLTGDLSTIVRVARRLGVPIEEGAKLPSGGYEVAHGTQVVGISADDTAPVVWTEGTSPAELAADLKRLLAEGIPAPAADPDPRSGS